MKKKILIIVSIVVLIFIGLIVRVRTVRAATQKIIVFEKSEDYKEVIDNSVDPNTIAQPETSNLELGIQNDDDITEDEAYSENYNESDWDASDKDHESYTVSDPDGNTNLRKTPGGEVMQLVYEGESFEVIGEKDNHMQVRLNDGTVGYIHKSRVTVN